MWYITWHKFIAGGGRSECQPNANAMQHHTHSMLLLIYLAILRDMNGYVAMSYAETSAYKKGKCLDSALQQQKSELSASDN